MLRLNVNNETSKLKAVVLGIGNSLGSVPTANECYDPKSRFHVLNGTYPKEVDVISQLDYFNKIFLKYDINDLNKPMRVIGNLPYNISTEIIFKMCNCNKIIDMHFMLQKEVVDRIVAKSNSKIYGRLSIMAQAYFNVQKLFDISENVFSPKPRVKSSFVRLSAKKYPFHNKNQEKIFYNIVKSAFEGRRKMIKTSLKSYLSENDFSTINLRPNLRAENLTVDDYIFISDYVQKV